MCVCVCIYKHIDIRNIRAGPTVRAEKNKEHENTSAKKEHRRAKANLKTKKEHESATARGFCLRAL
jgi:hypothetical protein